MQIQVRQSEGDNYITDEDHSDPRETQRTSALEVIINENLRRFFVHRVQLFVLSKLTTYRIICLF